LQSHALQRARTTVVAVVLAALGVAAAPPAQAAQPVPGHPGLVPNKPRTNTPLISTGEIWDFEVVGTRVYVVGTFSSLQNASGGTTVNQRLLAAFNLNTGQVDTGFRPTFSGGGVNAVEASPDGTKLYVAGSFNTVNGVTKRKVASINPTTGATVAGFTANAGAAATALAATNTTL
jgi:large repetitive protein